MAAYLTRAQFQAISTMPASFITEIEAKAPGWLDAQLELHSARIDAQLRKRYAVPFALPAPLVVQDWLARIVELAAWLKRGVTSTDEQFQEYKARAMAAIDEIGKAADSVDGLFDLPLSATGTASAVSAGFTRGYSEQSPYVWTDQQAEIGHAEDRTREGSRS